MKKRSGYEGLQKNIRALKTPAIDVWVNQYADQDYAVEIDIPEFTCICPKTGLPDFATINISYGPDRVCAELKSLKEYMTFYREIGIFHEHLANKIMEDFVKACAPRWVKLVTRFNPRGGITTTVTRTYERP
jgi:7-cyano-7-deazaguanine reductase